MANYYILTNNPAVSATYGKVSRFEDSSVEAVLIAARDAVHLGDVLISHPLAGSLKPNESPYKSIVLAKRRGPVDVASLSTIEDALAVLRKLPVKNRQYDARVLSDFAAIDLDLMHSAMQSLPAKYHDHIAALEKEAPHVNGL